MVTQLKPFGTTQSQGSIASRLKALSPVFKSGIATPVVVPRRLEVVRPSITVEGHTLTGVSLAGWAYGPEMGTAPVAIVVGGITASPFPLGDGTGEAHGGSDPWNWKITFI